MAELAEEQMKAGFIAVKMNASAEIAPVDTSHEAWSMPATVLERMGPALGEHLPPHRHHPAAQPISGRGGAGPRHDRSRRRHHVCLDVNYRSGLWTSDPARTALCPPLSHTDMLIASEEELALALERPGADEAEAVQAATNGWSVRTDVTPPTGLKPIWQYPNGNLDGFPRFMADRTAIERWKQTFALHFGDVKGDPPRVGWASTREPDTNPGSDPGLGRPPARGLPGPMTKRQTRRPPVAASRRAGVFAVGGAGRTPTWRAVGPRAGR